MKSTSTLQDQLAFKKHHLALLEQRAEHPDGLDRMALAAADRYDDEGRVAHADMLRGLVSVDRSLAAASIPRVRDEIATIERRIALAEQMRETRRRPLLPELDAARR
jgi:hypothetical protein